MKDLLLAVCNIFKYIGKALTLFRNFLFNLIFLVVLFFIVISFFNKEEVKIAENSILQLTIQGNIVEEKQINDSMSELLDESVGLSEFSEETLLQDIIDAIETASTDPKIGHIVVDMSKMGQSSLNQLHDIGEALLRFKKSGKKVIAAEDFYSQNKYYLATYADKVFLNPLGVIDIHGFSTYNLYFYDLLEKLKIKFHVFRVGTYKSAVEPMTRNSMSQEAKTQNSLWLNALWQEFKTTIMERREISSSIIDSYTNGVSLLLANSGGDTAQLAMDTNLVDDLKSREELRQFFKSLTSTPSNSEPHYVSLKDYLKKINRSYTSNNLLENAIGIIIAQGNILNGYQPQGAIGGDSLVELIRKAREDQKIKAVVLRIDSGGGSVFASEMIRRELQELKSSGKPLVVSMSSMAASGGYWIAAEADEIWAYPTTLTGSIGIFGAVPTFEDSLAQLGIYNDGVGTTEMSAGLNLTRPLSEELKKSIQLSIDHGYQMFLDIVSRGRNLAPEALAEIAEGRVFDGSTAQKLGLVDHLGNLNDAVAAAAKRAGMTTYSTRYIRLEASFQEKILHALNRNIAAMISQLRLTALLSQYIKFISEPANSLMMFNDPRGIYAHSVINYF